MSPSPTDEPDKISVQNSLSPTSEQDCFSSASATKVAQGNIALSNKRDDSADSQLSMVIRSGNSKSSKVDFADQFLIDKDQQKTLSKIACDNDESTHPNIQYVDKNN
jgi:hypothetical protein